MPRLEGEKKWNERVRPVGFPFADGDAWGCEVVGFRKGREGVRVANPTIEVGLKVCRD